MTAGLLDEDVVECRLHHVERVDDEGFTVASLELVQPTLDDVFVEKTGRQLEGAETAAPPDAPAEEAPVADEALA